MTFLVAGLFGSWTDTPGEELPGNPDPNKPQILSDENIFVTMDIKENLCWFDGKRPHRPEQIFCHILGTFRHLRQSNLNKSLFA